MASFTQATKNFLFGAISPLWMNARFNRIIVDGGLQNNAIVRVPDQKSVALAITAAQSGTTFILAATTVGGQTFTLPAAAVGLNYKFVCGTTLNAGSTSVAIGQIISFTAPGAFLFGATMSGAAGAMATLPNPGQTTIAMPATALTGDWFACVCDGTNWSCSGVTSVAGNWTHA